MGPAREQHIPKGRPEDVADGITSPEKAAEWLRVDQRLVRRWCSQERFRCGKLNATSWWIDSEDLVAFSKRPRQRGNPNFSS
jgi:hypothetical protein